MSAYQEMSQKPTRSHSCVGLWILILSLVLFALTLAAVGLTSAGSEADVFIVNRLWKHFEKGSENDTSEEEVLATVERIARDATNASSHGNNYYEEQTAVVVNAESSEPILAQRVDNFGPPQDSEDSSEHDPYYDTGEDYGTDRYYEGDIPEESVEEQSRGEGRASQTRTYDSYYNSWPYGGKPAPAAAHPTADGNNRKLQTKPNRLPYPAYDDVYDYPMGFQPRPHPETGMSKQATPPTEVIRPPVQTEPTLLTVLKSLKQIWDLYQAIISAWNSVSERHQQSREELKKEQAIKLAERQKLRQQQQQQQQQKKSRINSKKPPSIENKTKAQSTNTATETSSTSSPDSTTANSKEESATQAPAKVEPRRGAKGDADKKNTVRGLRQRRLAESEPDTDVGEGRYIKGDPLKGYYDFVITEGSYKFWAAFQVGTAILIIYSTFAAIYYSKVNPLTSDYDYTDYLGGGRSLSGGDDDFVDDGDAPTTPAVPITTRLMDWLPRTAHSLQFILDAIDKIPLDNDRNKELGWSRDADKDTMAMK